MDGNEIQDEGIKILAVSLKSNTRLRSLGLGGNQIGKIHCAGLVCQDQCLIILRIIWYTLSLETGTLVLVKTTVTVCVYAMYC